MAYIEVLEILGKDTDKEHPTHFMAKCPGCECITEFQQRGSSYTNGNGPLDCIRCGFRVEKDLSGPHKPPQTIVA